MRFDYLGRTIHTWVCSNLFDWVNLI